MLKWKKWREVIYDRYQKKGTLLNCKYKIEDYYGMGGYGMIYLCTDAHANTSYILKQLRPSKAKRRKEQQRFQSEAELLQTMSHPQIPQFIDYFMIDGQAYYVMQKINGKNLEEILFEQKQTFSELDALKFMDKLLPILEYLHGNHIFHRDIRPPNLILNKENVYLIDFGLAKQLTSDKKEEIEIEKRDDFYDMGECLLFILYSQFKEKKSRTKSWMEELTLSENTIFLIKRLLGISGEYRHTSSIRADLHKAIKSLSQQKLT